MKRIGVFVCGCGKNIAGTVDIDRVVEEIKQKDEVVYAENYQYLCSEPGQKIIYQAILEHELEGVVISACSPSMHQETFRQLVNTAGMNPYQCEVANIREQCSWVHSDEELATRKALDIVKSMVAKVRGDKDLEAIKASLTKKALVIGAGISGIQAALEIAESGHEVILLDRNSYIGGHMAQLSETFPTLDCSQCILTPKTAEISRHPKITLMVNSELEELEGYVGNFRAKIRRKATYVDWEKCNGCGDCQEKCPTEVASEFERGLGREKVISVPFPQAVPSKPTIKGEHCRYIQEEKCGVCQKICPRDAINFEDQGQLEEIEVGAIVVATGYDLLGQDKLSEYGYGRVPDVIDGLQFERLLSASGPTGGEIRRPSDGKIPEEVVFIQCVGSRDEEKGYPYCSRICCMYTAKHAKLYKHEVESGQAYVFYMDIRAGGKGYEEFIQQSIQEEGTRYFRGRVSRLYREGEQVKVLGVDTLSDEQIEIDADMVVLACAIVPNSGVKELAQKLKIGTDEHGFLNEAHPKLKPVESLTRGIYMAGSAQSPKDIPDTVSQAGFAASKVKSLFSGDELQHSPTVVYVEEDLCTGCGQCVEACVYEAREIDEKNKIARVEEVLCEGCGACVAACPNGATRHHNNEQDQLLSMIDEVLE